MDLDMVHGKSPALRKALRFLENRANAEIESGESSGIPFSALAREAGVSTTTLWKARRILSADHPSGTAGSDYASRSSPSQPRLWLQTASSIQKDIITGLYQTGAMLPSHKELQSRYGVSFRTLKKALSLLLDRNLLRRRHKGYIVTLAGEKTATGGDIVVLLPRLPNGLINWVLKGEELFHLLESMCARSGIALRTEFYDLSADSIRLDPHVLTRKSESWATRGYVVFHSHHEASLSNILQRISVFEKPTVVVSHRRDKRLLALKSKRFPLFLFPVGANRKPAETVARYLLGKGHRTVGYFSAFHKSPWSRLRYEGLRRMYAAAALTDGVRPFTLERVMKTEYVFFQEEGMQRCRGADLVSFYERWKKDIPYALSVQCDRTVHELVWKTIAYGEIAVQLQPFFKRADTDPSITAWVMANDLLAGMAIDYFASRSRARKPRPHLVSFDDTSLSVNHRITSFNFNFSAMASSIITTLLRPDIMQAHYRSGYVEIDGYLVER